MTLAAVLGLPIAAALAVTTGLWWILPGGLPVALALGAGVGAIIARRGRPRAR